MKKAQGKEEVNMIKEEWNIELEECKVNWKRK